MKRTNQNRITLFLLLASIALLISPQMTFAGENFTGGTVEQIVWSVWGFDKDNSACFVIKENGVNNLFVFDFGNNKQGKVMAAALVAALHGGQKVTVEHFKEAKYSCGLVSGLAKNVVGFIFDKKQ